MPRDIITTVYTFAELKRLAADPDSPVSQTAVERALDWLRQGVDDFDWWEYLIKEPEGVWFPALEQIGFTDPDISFSGFASQGDGASFTCKHVDVALLAMFLANPPAPSESIGTGPDGSEDFRPWIVHKVDGLNANPNYRRLARVAEHISAEVRKCRNSGNYCHEHTCEFVADMPYREADKVMKLVNSFEEDVESLRLHLSRAIYKSLDEEYTYLTSDEALAESAEENEYTFTAAGKREG